MKFMRYIPVIIAILGGIFFLKTMVHQSQKDSVCQELKAIAPDAPQEAYNALAQKLKENNLTTGDCIKHILDLRKQRAFHAVQQEIGFSDDEWHQHFPLFVKAVQEYNQSSAPTITCESAISPTLYQDLKTMIRNHGLRESIQIRKDNDVSIDQNLTAKINNDLSCSISGNQGSILYINPNLFKAYSMQAAQGNIAHEMTHRKRNHHEEEVFLWALAEKYNVAELETINKFIRTQEAEADRLPAACDQLCVARNVEAWMEDSLKILGTYTKYTHPTPEKRLAWATRIRRLREIEEQQHHKKV